MTIRSNKFVTRLEPKVDRDGVVDEKQRRRAADLGRRDLQRQIGEMEDAIPGDKNVRVEFRSKGPQYEIAVSVPRKALERRFDVFEVMRKNGPGTVWSARSSLQIGDKLIFKSDAPAGVTFVVRVYALTPARRGPPSGKKSSDVPPLPQVLDEPDPPPGAIQQNQQSKKKKKSGKN